MRKFDLSKYDYFTCPDYLYEAWLVYTGKTKVSKDQRRAILALARKEWENAQIIDKSSAQQAQFKAGGRSLPREGAKWNW